MGMRKVLTAIVAILLLGGVAYLVTQKPQSPAPKNNPPEDQSQEIVVKGVLVPGGVECQRLQTPDGTFYTIARNNLGTDLKEGDQVQITGTPAEVSFCQQDITLNVTKIEKLGSITPPADTEMQSNSSGITGTVTIGPTCPVVRDPPDPNCEDKPYQATIIVKTAAGKEITRVVSDKSGIFKVTLVPGEYILEPVSSERYPTAGPVPVTVEANKFTKVVIQFDSGIR